ncbi:MAG: A/G-specific adenine glycosylase [Pseudomonadota bacterium]
MRSTSEQQATKILTAGAARSKPASRKRSAGRKRGAEAAKSVASEQTKALATSARETPDRIVVRLLEWYDRSRRDLPWRAAPGASVDPYAVWLSEVMLQQTTVKAVAPYFAAFLDRWPTVAALAVAEEEAVLSAWAGLGYYSRARNLHACAKHITVHNGGVFPDTEAELLKLPGIGPYTAAAVAAIAFDRPTVPVDGNIERVVSRVFDIQTPLPAAKPIIKTAARTLAPDRRSGDFAQGLMDLGATICTPKRPSCLVCPLQPACRANAAGTAELLPIKAAKAARPVRHGVAFVAVREDGAVLLRKRPDSGLLASMIEVPSTDWTDTAIGAAEARKLVPVHGRWQPVQRRVTHIFTHFRLEMQVLIARVPTNAELTIWADAKRCRWVLPDRLDNEALPSVMRKILAAGLAT